MLKLNINQSEKNGMFYWNIEAENGKLLAGGLEPFPDRDNALRSFKNFKNRLAQSINLDSNLGLYFDGEFQYNV